MEATYHRHSLGEEILYLFTFSTYIMHTKHLVDYENRNIEMRLQLLIYIHVLSAIY